MALFVLSNSLGSRLKENDNAYFPTQWAPDFLRTNSKKEHQSEMGPSIPAATRSTLKEAKEAGNTQSLLFPSPGEKSKEKLPPLELGAGARAESSNREQAAARHFHGQPCTTGNLLREKHVALCVCSFAYWTERPNPGWNYIPNPRVFWDTVSLHVAQVGLKFWTFQPQLPNITNIHCQACV